MNLTDILQAITDYTGDTSIDNYPEDERLRDINSIYKILLAKIDLSKGKDLVSNPTSFNYTEFVQSAGDTIITLPNPNNIQLVEVLHNNNWYQVNKITVDDGNYNISELRDNTNNNIPKYYIDREGSIEILPNFSTDYTFRVHQYDTQDEFNINNLTMTPAFNDSVHNLIPLLASRKYFGKRDMAFPRIFDEELLITEDVFNKIYSPNRIFKLSFANKTLK